MAVKKAKATAKKGARKPKKTKPAEDKVADEIEGENKTNVTELNLERGFVGEELQALLRDIVYRPRKDKFEDIAKRWGIGRTRLWQIRTENKDEIERLRAEFFEEYEPEVRDALLESCRGAWTIPASGVNAKQAPNPKSLELFYSIRSESKSKVDVDSCAVYDTYWPYEKQAQFIYSSDPSGQLFTSFFIGGIGSGKTYALGEKAIITARRNRGRTGMLVSPTYKMLQNPLLQTLVELCELRAVPFKHRKADGILELWGDTPILLRSADNPENLRGPNLAWVGGDELRNWDSEAYRICLGRIRDPLARQRIFFGVSTPAGFDWLYDLLAGPDADKRIKNCVWYNAKSTDNPALPLDMVELARNTFSEDYAAQELEGKFVNVGTGRIYPNFDRSVHIKSLSYDPSLPIWIGQDFNVNPMASVICQPVRNGLVTEIRAIDEVSAKGGVRETIQALLSKGYDPKQRKEIILYPDATGWNNNAAAERSSLQQLKDAGFTIQSPKANPLIRDRYAAVNGKLRNANGVATLFIDPKCKSLIHDLEREVYQEGAPIREKTKDGAATRGHHSDALGYIIHREFAIETGFRPARIS